jgi:spoIIIJ-associated protein
MEWVETTGRTLEEAKEAALDELGVDAEDAEFEVLEEPKQGLFGRLRSEGRVRARVRPVAPPAKDDRRRRGRSGRSGGRPEAKTTAETAETATSTPEAAVTVAEEPAPAAPDGEGSDEGMAPDDGAVTSEGDGAGGSGAGRRRRNRSRRRPGGGGASGDGEPTVEDGTAEPSSETAGAERTDTGASTPAGRTRPERQPGRRGAGGRYPQDRDEEGSDVEVALDEQAEVATEFLRGLVDEFGLSAEIASTQPDDDTLELTLSGPDLGLLIGPKGSTLLAIQDLTRTVVQRKTGAGNGRIHVDVGGYRQKRAEALGRFARQVADEVKRTGVRKALEPMSAPDRKVVHDALTEVEGVSTVSEGEDNRRRVVISPSD